MDKVYTLDIFTSSLTCLSSVTRRTEFTLSSIEVNILNQVVEDIKKWFVENGELMSDYLSFGFLVKSLRI